MKSLLTLSFPFSASFTRDERVVGRNYIFRVTLESVDIAKENRVRLLIETTLIRQLHTSDLDAPGHPLANVGREDDDLLKAIWGIIQGNLSEFRVKSLELQRDELATSILTVF